LTAIIVTERTFESAGPPNVIKDFWKSARLNQFESDHFFARLLELQENPIRGSFDSAHLRHIHKYVFQDVYAWAGEFRDGSHR